MKANADALNRDIATIHSKSCRNTTPLKGIAGNGWVGCRGFSGYVLCARMGNENNARQNYNATAAVYQKVVTLEDKLVRNLLRVRVGKTDALRLSNAYDPRKDFAFRSPFS